MPHLYNGGSRSFVQLEQFVQRLAKQSVVAHGLLSFDASVSPVALRAQAVCDVPWAH